MDQADLLIQIHSNLVLKKNMQWYKPNEKPTLVVAIHLTGDRNSSSILVKAMIVSAMAFFVTRDHASDRWPYWAGRQFNKQPEMYNHSSKFYFLK